MIESMTKVYMERVYRAEVQGAVSISKGVGQGTSKIGEFCSLNWAERTVWREHRQSILETPWHKIKLISPSLLKSHYASLARSSL